MIAPAQVWERVNNIETPQLYPVFPWRIYGVGREGLEIARNTYLYDPDAQKSVPIPGGSKIILGSLSGNDRGGCTTYLRENGKRPSSFSRFLGTRL